MREETRQVIDALTSDRTVDRIIGGNLYPDEPPGEGGIPCVTYQGSQSPVLGADNLPAIWRITFDMECYQAKSAWELAEAVVVAMRAAGYVSTFMGDTGVAGAVHQVSLRFVKLKEV